MKCKCRGAFNVQMVTAAYVRKRSWWWNETFPRIARRELSRDASKGLFVVAQYRINMAFEEAVVELRSVLAQ